MLEKDFVSKRKALKKAKHKIYSQEIDEKKQR